MLRKHGARRKKGVSPLPEAGEFYLSGVISTGDAQELVHSKAGATTGDLVYFLQPWFLFYSPAVCIHYRVGFLKALSLESFLLLPQSSYLVLFLQ